jgi:PEP-CTERM motif
LELGSLNTHQMSSGRSCIALHPNGTIFDALHSTVTASFSNLTDLPVEGYAYARAQAESTGVAVAVPEPSAYVMFGIGLITIGARLKRKASR